MEYVELRIFCRNNNILCRVVLKNIFVGVSRPGVPKPTSECAACPSPGGLSAWASAKGGKERGGRRPAREVGIPQPSCSSRAQVGCACSRGLQASTRVREASGSKRAPVPVLVPARPTFFKKALVLPFIGVRRGSKRIMGCSGVLRV
jgi:hypothetical protein